MSALTEDEQDAVVHGLCEGFGAEDIAIQEGISANVVRAFIRSLHPSLLKEIYQLDGASDRPDQGSG